MSIELTEEQQHTLDQDGEEPPRVIDPRTKAAYILLPLAEYENVREIVEDEKRHKAIQARALQNASGRMNEDLE